jgi:serine/threonine protein kinase
MENFGYSLYKVLHPSVDPLVRTLEEARRAAGVKEWQLPPFCDVCRARVARNVASACRYLHDVGIMHRDLKDANVLVRAGRRGAAGALRQAC